ncbi:hypothetical protein ACTFIT_006563 [Dictyostelium discoideum]
MFVDNERKNFEGLLTKKRVEVGDLKKEIEKLNKDKIELAKKLNCYIGDSSIPANGIREYDIIIDIPSVDYLSQSRKSWIIYVSNQLKQKMGSSNYNKKRPLHSLLKEYKKFSTLACLGVLNKGKTFFINKYNGTYLPSGTQAQTIGLSLSISSLNETITIDTAGSNTALQVCEDKTEEHLARKESTEMFICDMSFSLASIIVYVLNELTWNDQRFILALQSKIQSLRSESNIIKKLLVVHNYPKVNSQEELLSEIKTYIESPFNGNFHHHHVDIKKIESKEEIVLFFVESVNKTHHFFLCNDNSEFGKRYNQLTIEKIRTYKNYNDNLDLDKVLLTSLQNNMIPYCKSPKKLKITEHEPTINQINNNNSSNNKSQLEERPIADSLFQTQSFLHPSIDDTIQDNDKSGSEVSTPTISSSSSSPLQPIIKDEKDDNIENKSDEANTSLKYKPLFTSFGTDEYSKHLKELCKLHQMVSPHRSSIKQIPAFTISPEIDCNRENDFKLIANRIEIIGLNMVFSSGFKPFHDIVKVNSDLRYIIEVPQLEMEDIEFETKHLGSQWYLNIKGIKKLRYDSNDQTTVYPSNLTSLCPSQNQRRDGLFEFSLPIPTEYLPIKPAVSLDKGVITFKFEKIG